MQNNYILINSSDMRIGIDLDDVLSKTTPAFIKFHNDIYGTNIKIEEMKTYGWWNFIGGSKDEYKRKVHEFITTSYGERAKLIKYSKEILKKLKRNNKLYIVTARSNDVKRETKKWVENNFPNIFSKIYFTDEFLQKNTRVTKKMICDDIDIDIFIEDNLEYAIECAGPNRKVYLLDYPWNQTDKLPNGVKRVYLWKEIGENLA